MKYDNDERVFYRNDAYGDFKFEIHEAENISYSWLFQIINYNKHSRGWNKGIFIGIIAVCNDLIYYRYQNNGFTDNDGLIEYWDVSYEAVKGKYGVSFKTNDLVKMEVEIFEGAMQIKYYVNDIDQGVAFYFDSNELKDIEWRPSENDNRDIECMYHYQMIQTVFN